MKNIENYKDVKMFVNWTWCRVQSEHARNQQVYYELGSATINM
jgi:hypothetical protein